MMRLFCGITVPSQDADHVVEDIRSRGLVSDKGNWRIEVTDSGPPDALFDNDDLSIEDTRSGESSLAVCACGELEGAAYYAFKHNYGGANDTPILIEFECDEHCVSVDAGDFLCTVFQMGDPDRDSDILCRCFGQSVLRYAKKAWETNDQGSRIAFCDLAAQDPGVIASHYRNSTALGGRHRTVFLSAFLMMLPVGPESIVNVWRPKRAIRLPVPQVHYTDCLLGR